MYLVVVLVLALTIAYFVVRDSDYDCAATHSIEGQYIVGEEGKSSGGKTNLTGMNTSLTGFLVSTSMALTSPASFLTNLRGKGKYRFEYSPNVTRIRVKVNQQLLYDGVPIPSLDAAAGQIEVEPHWTGNKMRIEISDQCSFGSFAESFFR